MDYCKEKLNDVIEFLAESYPVKKEQIYGRLEDVLPALSKNFSLIIFPNGKVLNLLEENHFLYPHKCWRPPFVTVRVLSYRELFVRVVHCIDLAQIAVIKDLIRTFPITDIYVEVYDTDLNIKVPYKEFNEFQKRDFLAYLRGFSKC